MWHHNPYCGVPTENLATFAEHRELKDALDHRLPSTGVQPIYKHGNTEEMVASWG